VNLRPAVIRDYRNNSTTPLCYRSTVIGAKAPAMMSGLAMLAFISTQFARGARRLPMPRAVRRLVRQQDGAAMVEFGLVAAPFLALVFAIIETAVVFFAGQALETAVADSSRLIMTGQAQTAGYDAAAFKNAVCSKIYGLFNCASGVSVDVQTFSSFSNVTNTSPVDANGNFNLNPQYNPGGPGDIVLVRLFYQYPVYVSLLGFNLQNVNGGKRLLAATAAFRNEPYGN
jgi:Flp pilus assembly protein TadG